MSLNPDSPVADERPQEITLPAGVPRLTMLYLYIAGSCNLACRHCWLGPLYDPAGQRGPFMSLEHVSSVVQQAKGLGLQAVKLTGGEPTLHPQFRELVDVLNQTGTSFTMETNGILIDDDLADYVVAKGATFISVSLDGATRETHEFQRVVAGSFDAAIRGIRALVKAGLRPQMICTLHQGNVGEAEQVVRLAVELNVSSVKFNVLQLMGRGERFAEQYALDLPQLLEVSRWIQDELAPANRVPITVDIPLAFRTVRQLVRRSQGICNMHNVLGVLATGELALCGAGYSTPDLVYGHLDSDNLADVWIKSPKINELRDLIPRQLEGICAECIHRDMCKGVCIANNYHAEQRINAPYRLCAQADMLGLFPSSRKIF